MSMTPPGPQAEARREAQRLKEQEMQGVLDEIARAREVPDWGSHEERQQRGGYA